ncbi:MAG: FKBP-type peptidyl-prolyl cis-trans isomerase [Chitinophagaceae bacterium]|nr:FKBP-type peptidyl-prolyl cis-trans isomerase [Chitinophagaceae bacterium]
MKNLITIVVICTITLTACTEAFKKGGDGIEYKIISKGNGKKLNYGNFMQMHIVQMYKGAKDTVLSDSRDMMPRIEVFDSVQTPPVYFKILRQLKSGDSLVLRTLTDSVFKKQPDQMPPYMKKGKYLYTTIKLVNIFETKDQADSANKAEWALAKAKCTTSKLLLLKKISLQKSLNWIKILRHWKTILLKNNIKAQKTKWGTFVVINTPGTGANASPNDVVTVNYTGKTFDSSKVFDSNIDPKFKHTQPYQVSMGQLGSVIPGWTDGFALLNKGCKATMYIPSPLGYGTQGNGTIKPNDILVFDIDMVNIEDEEALIKANQEKEAAAQKQMQEAEMKRADSLSKATPKKCFKWFINHAFTR